MIMNPKSWIKEALAKEADNAPKITSEFGSLPFKVVEECKSVDFMTKPDEIPIVIRDASELHIYALCKLSQKLQILSKMKPSTETLEQLHLRCHEYKFDLRENVVDIRLEDPSKPGIDYKIVIILIKMGEIGAVDPFTTGQDNTQIDKLWFFKSLKCRKYASVINNKLLNPAVVEHQVSPQVLIVGDSDESGESQKYIPHFLSESQEPPWIDSSTVAFSQSSEDVLLRALHRKSVSEKRDDGPSCSSTKTSADIESCQLQESVNPSTWDSQKYVPQIFSESQEPPWIDSSTEAFSQSSNDIPSWVLHRKSDSEKPDDGPPCSSTKTSADMESCRLQELVNPSALNVDLNSNILLIPSPRNHSTPEKAMDTEKLSDVVHSNLPCIDAMQESTKPASELPNQETDLAVIAKADVSMMMATDLDESFSRVLNSILIENQLILGEQVSLDNSDTRNTLLDQAADMNPTNGSTILEKAAMKAGDDMNTNLGVAGTSRDTLEQQNLAHHTCHVINRSLINVGLTNHVKSSDVTYYQSLKGTLKTEMFDHALDQSPDENPLNQALCLRPRDQPSGRHRLDQSSVKRKKRISKKIHGTVMYPIPTSSNNEIFEKYRCTKTFFIVSDSDSEHRQNKLYTINPIISHEFRHGLLQQLKPSSSDSDPGKTTREVSHTGMQTPELSVTSPNQNKPIPSRHIPIDVKISQDFKRRILKLIDRNLSL